MSFVTNREEYYSRLNQVPYEMDTLELALKDVKGWGINSDWREGLSLTLFEQSKVIFTKKFDIGLGLDANFPKDIDKPLNSYLGLGALKVGNAGQVIGDIRFYDTVLNETNYDSTITPYGYGKWKEMVTGDYIYTKALCKYSMQASLNADRPNTRVYLHKVDVPDVVDRGTVELTKDNQPLWVKFSKEEVRKFHIVPELNVSIKSYSGVDTPPIVIPYNTTTEGFYVTMKSGGEFVEGSITYAARGY